MSTSTSTIEKLQRAMAADVAALDAALAGDGAGALGGSAPAGAPEASATRALDKSYHWRGVAYPAGDAVAVPADFPSQADVDAWRHAPAPFDFDSVFPPPAPVAPVAEAVPFVSAAGAPIPVDPQDETWPAAAAREQQARDAAAGRGESAPSSLELSAEAQAAQRGIDRGDG